MHVTRRASSTSSSTITSRSTEYAKEREAFGSPIIMNQGIAFKLGNMATEIDAARLLVRRAAWMANNGGYRKAEGSMRRSHDLRTHLRDQRPIIFR